MSTVHETACVDAGASIGEGTQVWHFCHVMSGARIGRASMLGQNVFVAGKARIGDRVRIQNNVSVYDGVEIDDDVFIGPGAVFTNVSNPRAAVSRKHQFERTLVRRGATIGANATIVCGVTVGRHAFIGAGAVITSDVPDYGLALGVPARVVGWMSRHGYRLLERDTEGLLVCPEGRLRYREDSGMLRCVDLDEDAPLP